MPFVEIASYEGGLARAEIEVTNANVIRSVRLTNNGPTRTLTVNATNGTLSVAGQQLPNSGTTTTTIPANQRPAVVLEVDDFSGQTLITIPGWNWGTGYN